MPAEALWIFILRGFPLRLAMRESSKVETTWWTVQRQARRSAASVDHWWWSMWQVSRAFLREYLKRFLWSVKVACGEFTIQALSQLQVESLPYMAILGRRCPTFLRHALPIVAIILATWPLWLWFLPDHWRRSHSCEYWGWCGDSADESAQGVVDGSGRLPMTQSHTAGCWVRQFDRHWS